MVEFTVEQLGNTNVVKWIPIQEIRKSITNLKTHFLEITMSKHDGIVLEMSIKSSLLHWCCDE
jgi:hypothetical protein